MKFKQTTFLFIPITLLATISYADLKAGAPITTQVVKDNNTNFYQTYNRVKINNPKALLLKPKSGKRVIVFKPFIPKQVIVTLDGSEINLSAITDNYKGKIFNTKSLLSIKDEISEHFIKKDYLLPQIHLLEDQIKKHEILKLEVTLNPIKQIIFKEEGPSNPLIEEYANKILAENPAKVSITQRYLGLMNQIAGYDIIYALDKDNDTDDNINLIIFPQKKKYSTYVGLDNYGDKDTGKYQTSIVSQVYSPFGHNESLLIHGSTTNHPERMSEIGGGYSKPINAYGTSAHLSYSSSIDNQTKADEVTAPNNFSDTARISLTHQLLLKPNHQLELRVGASNKLSKLYLIYGNKPKLYKKSNFQTGDIGLKHILRDKFKGRTLTTLSYIKGLSGKFNNYLISNNIPDKHFDLIKFDIYRDQDLPSDFSILSHFAVDYSKSNLPDSYKTSIGGRDFGRGYKSGSLSGKQSTNFSIEGRYTKHIENKYVRHAQPYAFYDVGYIRKKDSGANVSTLESVGAGLRFRMQHNVDFGIEAAKPLKKYYAIQGVNIKSSTKISIFLNKIFEF